MANSSTQELYVADLRKYLVEVRKGFCEIILGKEDAEGITWKMSLEEPNYDAIEILSQEFGDTVVLAPHVSSQEIGISG